MSDLGEWIEQLLHGRESGGEAPSLREVAQEHLVHYGSGRKAAKAWGVNESVFRRLVSGKTSSPKASTVAKAWHTERERSARRITNADIRLPVTERRPSRAKGGRGRHTELDATRLKITDPAAAERIRQAYIAGGAETAAVQLLKEIRDPHYQKWLTPDPLRPRGGGGGGAGGGGGGGGLGAGRGGAGGGAAAGGGGGGGWLIGGDEEDWPDADYGYSVG